MIGDLLEHELEIVKSFFARAMSWSAAECAAENAMLEHMKNRDEETIEDVITHPRGAQCLEEIALRSVINELNALCEFSLQNIWVSVTGDYALPDGKFIFAASRHEIEKALLSKEIQVDAWPHWPEASKIKELSEAFKHRQRLQPFPSELRNNRGQRSIRLVDPTNSEPIATYEVTPSQVSQYLTAVEKLFRWLRHKYAL